MDALGLPLRESMTIFQGNQPANYFYLSYRRIDLVGKWFKCYF